MCATGGMMEPSVTNQPVDTLTGAGFVGIPIGHWIAI